MDGSEEPPVPFGTLRPSERRALIGCAFAAMCILLLPGELAGAGICAALAIGLFVWHHIRTKREKATAEAAARPAAEATSEPTA